MSVWATGPQDHHSRISTLAMVAVAVMVSGLVIWHAPAQTPLTANELGALAPVATPVTAETLLPSPLRVQWEGRVERVFVSGEGLEVVSSQAPEGAFHAYMPQGSLSPVTTGFVSITGAWTGYTCDYGGWHGSCVPEVQIQAIASASAELE